MKPMPFEMLTPTNKNCSASKQNQTKLEVSYKKLTMGFQNYKQIKEAHLRNRVCEEPNQYKQNKECAFQPRLSSKKPSQAPEQRRSLKKFLEDQEKFTSTKRKKIQQLRQQISRQQQEELKAKPSIDSVSHRISTQIIDKKNENVFKRLSKQKAIIHNVFEQEDMFSPKICPKSKSLRRQKDVSNLLYQDAQRRRQKEQMHFEQLLKKDYTPQINSNTNNLVIKKIYTEFTQKVHDQVISPLLAITVLSQIFNIDLNPNKSPEQEELCQKVLFYIADIKTETVYAEVLWNFIQTVVNGHLISSNFTQEQQDQIIQNFGSFYTSRLTKTKRSVTPQQYTFKPKTLRSSQKLANNYRDKTLSSINEFLENQKVNVDIKNNSLKIEDLFIIEHMKKNSEMEKKRMERQNNQLQKCSFKPNLELSTNSMIQTYKTTHKRINLIPRSTKTQELQMKVKLKKKEDEIQNKENQQRLKTMYELSCFMNSKRLHTSTSKKEQNHQKADTSTSKKEQNHQKAEVKNIEKSVMRVTLARKNRELVTALNERGYPSNVENWDSFRKSIKKDVEKSSQKFLKGYNSVQKYNASVFKTSALLVNSKQPLQ